MPQLPRDRPHFYLHDVGLSERYTSRQRARNSAPPARDREAHARELEASLNRALAGARAEVRPAGGPATGGFYLQFELPVGSAKFVQNLEDRRRGVELVSVRQSREDAPAFASVFVPFKAANHFQRMLERYRTQVTPKGRPKHAAIIDRIDSIALAGVRALFTDDERLLPAAGHAVWWEVWVRRGHLEEFQAAARHLDVGLDAGVVLGFPERQVTLAFTNLNTLGTLVTSTESMAEIRLARDTPASFVEMDNMEGADWVRELLRRTEAPGEAAPAVCLLDSGVTRAHPLISVALAPSDAHTYNPAWGEPGTVQFGRDMGQPWVGLPYMETFSLR